MEKKVGLITAAAIAAFVLAILSVAGFFANRRELSALKAAARSGVDVRVMLPAKEDSFYMGSANKSYFRECLLSGVKFYLRDGEFMHCKTFVTDDYLSSVGTANMDKRSFSLNYEDNSYIYDRELALQCRDIFEKDLERCREVTLEEVQAWKWY